MNTQINITENGTTTLATAGKYCDRNIDVNVEVVSGAVYDTDAILEGTFSGEYVSDKVTHLRAYALADTPNLTSVSLSNCTIFNGSNIFKGAERLETVNLPNLTTMTNARNNFHSTKITVLSLPSLTTITDSTLAFYAMPNVITIILPKLSGVTFNASAFSSCRNLTTLVLGGIELNPLSVTNAFNSTPIASGTGYIYVRNVDTYKQATNWATYASQIAPYVLTVAELENIDGITYPRCWVDETHSAYTYDGTKWTEVA